ncbi:MAG: NUDIX domain-containing protein [Thermoproteus sp.]|nr:NUDIX domain-containing protein [Thermoproteus sp.]
MPFNERAAGAVVYLAKEEPLYLLLHNKFGWDFPHGLVRPNETEEEAALREIYEETRLKVERVPGFAERVIVVFSRRGKTIYKEITFYLAEALSQEVKLSREHDKYAWLPYGEALIALSRDEVRRVLVKANNVVARLAAERRRAGQVGGKG